MGLFSNNKKLCPICGSPTPRLLATCIEDQPLCKACAAKIDLPSGSLDQMSLDTFRHYLVVYNENAPLRESFNQTFQFSFGFFSGGILLDTEHRLLRLKYGDGAFAFTPENITSFRILEDGRELMEGSAAGLILYRSEVPEMLAKLAPQIAAFRIQKREYEHLEQMDRLIEQRGGKPLETCRTSPSFDVPAPVQKFTLEIKLKHPFWGAFSDQIGAPSLSRDNPDADEYQREYAQKVTELHTLAVNMMKIINPAAPERRNVDRPGTKRAEAAPAAPAAPAQGDTVSELKRYKELLDAGVLTEEEFTAKKKQLLGI